MALRILPQLLPAEPEHRPGRILELLRHLGRDVVVRREAELVLALRGQGPFGHHELDPRAGRRGIERRDDDGRGRRETRVQQRLRPPHGPRLWSAAVDPHLDEFQLILAEGG